MVEGTAMTEYIDKTIPKFRGWTPEYAREYERQGTPTGRRATLTEIAQAVVWVLLGPDQMTGAIISVNGGR
jgi:NAD(P)-dependent dehydrogenase (short-subunit alcohol dehydrogenase family)